jgi:hypothetical protein
VKRIPVDQAKPGQILAESIARHDGVLLANQGSEVSEGLLRMLVRLNVDTIVIEEEEGRTEEEIRASHGENLSRLDRAFRRVGGQPVLMALKKTLAFLSKEEMEKGIFALRESQEKGADEAQAANGTQPEEGQGEAVSPPPKAGAKASKRQGKDQAKDQVKD